MPHIEIETPASPDGSPAQAYGTVVKLNGQEVPEVRSIQIDIGMDAPVTARIDVLATELFHFAADVDLHVTAVVNHGYVLVERTEADGTKTYRAKKDDAMT